MSLRIPSRYVGWLLIAIAPALITALSVWIYYGAQASCAHPGYNDEISHWHQVKTFAEVGFQGGYYAWNEKIARNALTHFSLWGSGFPAIIGTLSRPFGWHPHSAIYYNMALITVALGVMVLISRPTGHQAAILIAFSATFWPLLLYMARTMQTSFHISAGVLFGALFYARGKDANRDRVINAAFVALLLVVATVQFTW